MEYIECPYCKELVQINHDDGFGYEEDIKHQMGNLENPDKYE